MANIDYDKIWQSIAALAQKDVKNYAEAATADGKNFVEATKAKFERYVDELAQQEIDEDDFKDDVLNLAALADMERLKEQELAEAAIDQFVNGVIDILIAAGLQAI
ncbi:MAG TPA: hypothetical protein VGG02_11650 [Chthoniobacterales bacterium]|jgi:hypothetical protein